MNYFANILNNQDISIWMSLVFVIIGFIVGFFLKFSSKNGKIYFQKLEKDAHSNQSRINSLKQKIEELERDNRSLGGPNAG